ncbi:MAG: PpGpp-regulated growth inhibitor ChpA/MazF [Parcubacteria group bacterium GW2011_GWA2_51_10]|nr:MAG: PpGpp-regulated growth inhibitor ChpA/MazF [Parcubacteria group bacterium GW2011_GWA2_51_10]
MVSRVKTIPPDRGDIMWITLDPTRGHEQAGRRPAVVLSKREFNRACGIALIIPITSKHKGYSNEVPIATKKIKGSALTSHLRAIDWKSRHAEFIDTCPREALREIQDMCAVYISGE